MRKKGKKLLTFVVALAVVLTTVLGSFPTQANTVEAASSTPYLAFRWSSYNESTEVHSEDTSKELVTSWGADQSTSPMFFYYVAADGSETLITDVNELYVADDYVLNITPDATVTGLMHVELANTGVSEIYYTVDGTATPVTLTVSAGYNLFAQYHGEGFVFPNSSFGVVPQLQYVYLDENQNFAERTLDASEYTIRASLSDNDNGLLTATVTSDNEVVIAVDSTATVNRDYNVTLTASVGGVDVATDTFNFCVTDQYYAIDSAMNTSIKKGETVSLSQFSLVQHSATNGTITFSDATYAFDEYDTNVWALSADGQILTRISNDSGYFVVGAYRLDDNSNPYVVTSEHYNFESIYAHTRIVHNNSNNLYDNADLECMIELNTSVDASDITVEFEVGTGDIWQDDAGFHNEFVAFDTQAGLYTVTTDATTGLPTMITLHGEKVKALRDSGEFNSDFVSVKITTYIGTEQFQLDSSGFNYFNTDPSYMGFGYEEVLTGESRTFGTMIEYCDYTGAMHSQPITSMVATGGDTDAVSIKYIDSTVDANITDPFWVITGEKAGVAEITVTHENPDDANNPMTYTFTVDVADERYHIWVNSEGTDMMFPTDQKALTTEMNHEYLDDNGNNCGEPVNSYTAQVVSTSSNEVTATIDAKGVLTITSNNAAEGHYTIEIAGTVNGNVVSTTTYDLWISKTYYELTPYALDNVMLGETLEKSAFTLNYYDADNTSSPVTDVTNNATLTLEYDSNVWSEDASTGNLTRKDVYDTEVIVTAKMNDDEVARCHYHFGELRADAYIFFGENDTTVVNGIDVSFPVNVNASVDMSNVTVTAQLGSGEWDAFVPYTDQSGCALTQDADGNWFIHFDASAIKALYTAGALVDDSFVVKTTAYIGSVEFDSNYVHVRYLDSVYTDYYCQAGVIEDCQGLVTMNTMITEEIICRDYTGAETPVTVTNVVSDSSAVTVIKDSNSEFGTFWALELAQKGVANITITYIDPADSTKTVDFTVTITVVTDQIGHGHEMITGNAEYAFPGDEITRKLIVSWEHYDASTGEIVSTDISDKATFNWGYESDTNSFTGTNNNSNIGTITVSSTAGVDERLYYGCDITFEVDGETLYSGFRNTMHTTEICPVITAPEFPSDYGFEDVATITPDIYLRTYDYTTRTEGKSAIPSDITVYLEWYTRLSDDDITLYCNGTEIPYVDRMVYDASDVYTAKRNAVWDAFDTSIWVEVYLQSFDDNNNEIYEQLGYYAWSLNATACPHPSAELEVRDSAKETCTQDGYTGDTYCTVCGDMVEEGEVIGAAGHNYAIQTVVSATCTDAGYTVYLCSCGDTYDGDEVAALGHKTELQNAKAATCTEKGYTGDQYCTVCETTVEKGTEIASTGHSYTSKVTAPTCTAEGYTTYACACGDIYTANKVAALGHTTVLQNAKAATCTEKGYTGDQYCTVCKTVVLKGTVIPAPGHDYTSVVTAPTCTTKGYTTHTCTCGDTYTDAEVAAPGHKTELQNAKDATCTEAGYTGDQYCTVCKTVVLKGTVIPATGHSHTSKVTPATCTVAGSKVYTCACGDTYTEVLQPVGHIFGAGKCSVCQTADPDYKPATEVEMVVSQTTQQEAAKATEDITNTVSDVIKEAKAEAEASGATLSTEKLVETVKEALTESKDNDVKAVVDAVSEETMEKIIVAVEEEKEIITTVVAQPVSEEVITQMAPKDVEKIEKFAGSHSVVAQYLDLSVLIQAKDADGNVETLGTVDEPTKEMTFTLTIPENLRKEGRTYYIILVHDDGAAERVKVTNNGDGTVSFKANKFSTYALAYTDQVAPITGDMIHSVPMATYIVLFAAVAVLLTSIRLKRMVRVR